jgi:hypothetical protein
LQSDNYSETVRWQTEIKDATKAVLDDSGNLSLFNEDKFLWTSFTEDAILNTEYNSIPDSIKSGAYLVSDDINMNRLLSFNREHLAMIQSDGNFVVYSGVFDSEGNGMLQSDQITYSKGFDSEPKFSPAFVTLDFNQSQIQIGRLVNSDTGQEKIIAVEENLPAITENSKLVLSNSGKLTVISDNIVVWSS